MSKSETTDYRALQPKQNQTTDIIGRTLWNAHVWMSWEEAKTEDSLIAMECLEDAEAIVLALEILDA